MTVLLWRPTGGAVSDVTGKTREPLLRLIQFWRAYDAAARNGNYHLADSDKIFGEGPLLSPSVFNFFRPGYAPPGEIEGRHVREVLGEAAWERVRPYMERALAGETVRYEDAMPYERGGTRWVEVVYTPDRGPDGHVLGFVVLVHDISERKRAELALVLGMEQSERKRALVTALSETLTPEQVARAVIEHVLPMTGAVAGTLGEGPEAALARQIVRLPEVVEDAVTAEETHGITAYATELATAFHAFYRDAKVVDPKDPERSATRLALARAAQVTLARTLGLLGISAPESM